MTLYTLVLVTGMTNHNQPVAEFVKLEQTINFKSMQCCIEAKEAIKYAQWHNVIAIKVTECKEDKE